MKCFPRWAANLPGKDISLPFLASLVLSLGRAKPREVTPYISKLILLNNSGSEKADNEEQKVGEKSLFPSKVGWILWCSRSCGLVWPVTRPQKPAISRSLFYFFKNFSWNCKKNSHCATCGVFVLDQWLSGFCKKQSLNHWPAKGKSQLSLSLVCPLGSSPWFPPLLSSLEAALCPYFFVGIPGRAQKASWGWDQH